MPYTYDDVRLMYDNIVTTDGIINSGQIVNNYDEFYEHQPSRTILERGFNFGHVTPISFNALGVPSGYNAISYENTIYMDNGKSIRVSFNSDSGARATVEIDCLLNGEIYEYTEGDTSVNLTGVGLFNMDAISADTSILFADGGFDLMLFESYNRDDNTDEGFSLGLFLCPTRADTGTQYPIVPLDPVAWFDHPMLYYFIPLCIDSQELQINALGEFLHDISDTDWAYDDGDASDTWAGGGGGAATNDAMSFASLPSISILNSGFVSLYAPTEAQIRSISQWLWSSGFYDAIIKNFASPFDNIIGLWISPRRPASAQAEFTVGNVGSGIQANKVAAQYEQISLGRVNVKKYYNSFADYDNYRAFKLFLPYYGIVDMSTDDFVGGTVEIAYNIDYVTGSGLAQVMTTRGGIPHILHQYPVNIYAAMPYSGVNMMNFYTQAIGASSQIVNSIATDNPFGMVQGVTNLVSAHPTFGGSKSMGGLGGLMGIQYPYLIECRSIRDMPQNYNKYNGIPLNKYYRVNQISGYTEFDSVRVDISGASADELNEIETILKGGIII